MRMDYIRIHNDCSFILKNSSRIRKDYSRIPNLSIRNVTMIPVRFARIPLGFTSILIEFLKTSVG